MNSALQALRLSNHFPTIPYLWVATVVFIIFAILLSVGRRLDTALRFEKIGIPISLLIGVIALLVGPYGVLPVLPQDVTDVWINFPIPLLTIVFATLMLGRPIPSGSGLVNPVTKQVLLGFLLGFGQYLVGGIVVLSILKPYLGVDPLMGCLIEVGFEGGHGAAAVMGENFEHIGFNQGLELGLAMATVGLLSSTLIGSFLIIIGRFLGWILPLESIKEVKEDLNKIVSIREQLRLMAANLFFIGIAILIALSLISFIRLTGQYVGGSFQEIADTFPIFPLALFGSLITRFFLEKFDCTELVSPILQREIGILSTDLLIITAMAGLDLPLLSKDWVPLVILGATGLAWNLIGMFVFAKISFNEKWFERSIIEFGNATGVAASGILLLRLADPEDSTNTLQIFSIKQLFLQPLLSGGLVTVVAPTLITSFGLKTWTEFCGFLTISILLLAFFLTNKPLQEQA